MTETESLVAALKTRLRAQKLTYRDVAVALGLSEPSVKRMFASGHFTLDRLSRVASLVGFSIAELAQHAEANEVRLSTLTEAQERELVSDIRLLLVAVCAVNHWKVSDMLAAYRLTEAECLRCLLRLDRLRLIDLLPGNRIRICVSRDFDWLPHGPIRSFFRSQGLGDFLDRSFAGVGEEMNFLHGMLTDAARAEFVAELRILRKRFAALHDESVSVPVGQRRGVGLLLAMREWEPAAFARMRRT